MTFGSVFGRTFSPTFHPKSQAKVGGDWWLAGGINPANCIAAYQAKGVASYTASKVNLANPGTYNATEGNAPDWDATNGWKFNGTNDYLITGFSGALQTSSVIIAFSNVSSSNGALFGAYYDGNFHYLIQPYHTTPGCRYWSGSSPLVKSVISSGILAITGNKAYKNGVAESGTLPTGSSTKTPIWYLGGYNSINTLALPLSCYIQAFAYYDTALLAAQVSALTTAMAAL